MENNNDEKVEDKVMNVIKTGKIKLRSRFLFLLEKLGIGGAVAVFATISALFFCLVLFYMNATDHLQYLNFGRRGIFAFIESFPFLIVIAFIFLLAIAGFILKKSDFLYKKHFGWVALGLLGVIIILGTGLAFTSLSEKIERHTFDNRGGAMFMHPFLDQGLQPRSHGIVGKISAMEGTTLTLNTPRGTETIDASAINTETLATIKIDSFITAVGERQNTIFKALDLRIADENRMPMIHRGIDRKFPGIPRTDARCLDKQRECPFR